MFFRRRHTVAVLALILTLIPAAAHAAEADVELELRPHCTQYSTGDDLDDDWALGPIPSPGIVIETGDGGTRVSCKEFEVLDPNTLKTRALRVGDILDIDILILNPSKHRIERVRAWLNYDPEILKGELLQIREENFPNVTPTEKGFFPDEGYAKMEASSGDNAPKEPKIIFARLQFRVLKTTPAGTPITFHDVAPEGHTDVTIKEGEASKTVLKEEPGALMVLFVEESSSSSTSNEGEEASSSEDGANSGDGGSPECLRNEECQSGLCISGKCQESQNLVPNGGSCTFDAQCVSKKCADGTCVPNVPEDQQPADTQATRPDPQVSAQGTRRTAFSLLQVRNLRATTEEGNVFLAWDHLNSSALKAYNVYYGTTSGRYIQRKTVDGSSNSLTLRGLPVETKYYFAVRAVSTSDEESAFSQEVSVIIGDPNSSTAPLNASTLQSLPPRNPVETIQPTSDAPVPGKTGAASSLSLLLIVSAVIGTILASRRQFIAHTRIKST